MNYMKKSLLFLIVMLITFFVSFSIVHASESHSSTITNKIQYTGGSVVSNTANTLLGGKYSSINNSDSNRARGSYGSDWKVGKFVDETEDPDGLYDAIYLKHTSGTTTYSDAWYVIKNAIKYNGKYYDTKTTVTKISGVNAAIANRTDKNLTGHLGVRGNVENNVVKDEISGQVEITVKIEIFEAGTTKHAYLPDIYSGLLDIDYSGSFYTSERLTKDNALIFNKENVNKLMYNSSANSLYSTDSGNTDNIANVYWKSKELKQGTLNIVYGYKKAAGVYMDFGHIVGLPEKNYASDTPSGKNNSSVKVGDTIKYSIKYTNGADSSSAVVVTDKLSKGLEYVASSANVGEPTVTKNSDGTTTLVWNRTLASKASEEITYSAKVNSDALYIVQNNAKVKIGESSDFILDPLKNPLPEKEYGGTSLNDNPGWDHHTVKVGESIKYKITLGNAKGVEQKVTVTDVLSKGLTYNKDISVKNGTLTTVSEPVVDGSTKQTTLNWVITIPAGQTAELNYSAKVNDSAVKQVKNNASVTYEGDSLVKLAELENPIVESSIIRIPDTASSIAIVGIVAGVLLIGLGGYVIYTQYKKS